MTGNGFGKAGMGKRSHDQEELYFYKRDRELISKRKNSFQVIEGGGQQVKSHNSDGAERKAA